MGAYLTPHKKAPRAEDISRFSGAAADSSANPRRCKPETKTFTVPRLAGEGSGRQWPTVGPVKPFSGFGWTDSGQVDHRDSSLLGRHAHVFRPTGIRQLLQRDFVLYRKRAGVERQSRKKVESRKSEGESGLYLASTFAFRIPTFHIDRQMIRYRKVPPDAL